MKRDGERMASDLRSGFAELRGPVQSHNCVEVATHRASFQSTHLRNGDRVAIVGGGPAGSFFARHLLRESRRLNRQINVCIVEKRRPMCLGTDDYHIRGCNFCAGGISPRLNEILKQHGLVVPDEIIQEHIEYVWVHGQWKNFRLRVPKDVQMYSIFRGSLPAGRGGGAIGFDEFLLGEAIRVVKLEVDRY